jgi:outer membrane protein assembly factor BamA
MTKPIKNHHSKIINYLCIWILLMSQSLVSSAQTANGGDSLRQAQTGEGFFERNSSSRWVRELQNIIIVPPRSESEADTFSIQSPGLIYLENEGRIITAIRIVRLKPFGVSVADVADDAADNDTGVTAGNINWLGRAGNAIHVGTREFIIRNALLFKEGDRVTGLKLAYSERYLRSMDFINDAHITAIPVSDYEAEVLVVVQDILPYSVNFGSNFASRANLAVTNRNIIGVGVELRAGTFIDSQKDHLMGYEARLRLPNIWKSFVSLQADYLDRYENRRYGFTLQRDFYAPTTRYAGHLMAYSAQTPVRYFDSSGSSRFEDPMNVKYRYLDVWFGRSFRIERNTFQKLYRNLTLSFGARQIHFMERPENAEELYYTFQNRTVYLGSLTYSQQAFYKTNLIYNFGKTEDIPYGFLLSAVGGKEMNEKYNRPYLGVNAASGFFIRSVGYLSGAVSFGTFFRKGVDQGMLDLELNYFTPLYVIGDYRHRTFINGQYTRQLYNRMEDMLVIDGDHGIPGFRNDSVLGRHRFNLSAEQDLFTPWNFHGFRFVMYGFAHFSWLGGYDTPIIFSSLYSSFGFGFRIRNNRLIFNTLQIQFAYFPNIPKNSSFRYIYLSTEKVLQPRDFKPKAPEVIPLY